MNNTILSENKIYYFSIPLILILSVFSLLYIDMSYSLSLYYIAFIFGLPHIILSIFLFFGHKKKEIKENINSKTIISLILGFIVIALSFLINKEVRLFLILFATNHHVIKQQLGLCRIYTRTENNKLYKLLHILLLISLTSGITPSYEPNDIIFIIFLAIYLFIFYKLQKENKTKSKMIIFSAFIFLLTIIFFHFEYKVLAYIFFRVSHDVSAILIYHNTQENNKPLSSLKYLGIIFIVYLINTYMVINSSIYIVATLYVYMTYFHYYIESFMWKSSSKISFRPYFKIN